MARVHLALALAALLVLAGCTGGGAGPSATTETTGETDEPMAATTAEESTATTAGEAETTASRATTAETADEELPDEGVFEYYGVALNYSAGGDLDAEAVARSHLAALGDVESLSASSVERTEIGNRSTIARTAVERDANRSLLRTNGAGPNVTVYRGEDGGAMKTVRDGEANYVRLGNDGESDDATGGTDSSAFVMVLAKLQAMPYEEVGTVTRDGTALTKYEATGPGYYADGALSEDASVESFSSTVLVGEDGLVRSFNQTVVVERGGETAVEESTLRYEDVGSTTVTTPEWAETVLSEGGEDEEGDEGE